MKSIISDKILFILGFKREKKIKIQKEVVISALQLLKTMEWDDSFISPVWQAVFSKFDISKLNEGKDEVNYNIIDSCYEEFFLNGLSDGACVGSDLKRPRSALKYALRGRKRLNLLRQHFNFQNGNEEFFSNLILSPQLSSGQPWLQFLNNRWLNPELIDHLYFYEVCKNLPIKSNNLLFIGDGSGLLSNIFLNNSEVSSASFIDLPHFLLRQHIVNYDLFDIPQKYLTPDRVHELPSEYKNRVLINQDSLPEIPEKYLNIYFDLITNGYVSDVLSYNKKDSSFGHTDFKKILLERNIQCRLSIESVMRPGYFIEWYSVNDIG